MKKTKTITNHKNIAATLLLVFATIILAGCGSASNPISTDFSDDAGPGPKINMSLSNSAIPFGGTAVIKVAVADATGKPVPRSALEGKVIFASILGGTFKETPVYDDGIITSTYSAPSNKAASIRAETEVTLTNLPIVDEVTVSYFGATAKISVLLYEIK